MRRADRLFDIIQRLRTARGPMDGYALAEELEVTVRTVYRDVATLQARRVPIEGRRRHWLHGLRRGFDLPPLMFTIEDRGDRRRCATGLAHRRSGVAGCSGERALEGHGGAAGTIAEQLAAAPLVSASGAPVAERVDLAEVRQAIRDERKLDCLCGRGRARARSG